MDKTSSNITVNNTDFLLHNLRNPYKRHTESIKADRAEAATLIEDLFGQLTTLRKENEAMEAVVEAAKAFVTTQSLPTGYDRLVDAVDALKEV